MLRLAAVLCVLASPSLTFAQSPYYPERFDWPRRAPAQAGLDAAAIDAAVAFAVASENSAPRDLAIAQAIGLGAEPFDTPIGPHKPRAAANGLILRNGDIVAEWATPAPST